MREKAIQWCSGSRWNHFTRFLALLFLLLTTCFIGQVNAQQASVLGLVNLRVAGDDSRLRLIAVFNARPDYKLLLLDSPARLVINLPEVDFSAQKQPPAKMGMVKDIRYGVSGPGAARIILTTVTPFNIEKDTVQQLDGGLWQLVVDLTRDSRLNFDNALKKQRELNSSSNTPVANNALRPFRVVIDAGHGGIDSGAQGISGILEKDVTLAFAKALRDQLEKKTALDVFLTRDSDVFLRLNERVQKARGFGADLFISIHADTINTSSLRGATVYTISDKASDDVARALAERENKADLLDGLPADETPEVTDILIDLTRRETHAFSVNFADRVVMGLSRSNINLIKNSHRYAGFQVLKAPDVPSVLIEIGYLSNREDERLISDPIWRARMATAIANAVYQFAEYRSGRASNPQ